MKKTKFAHKARSLDAAEPFGSAEEARLQRRAEARLHHLDPQGFLRRRHRPAPFWNI